MAVVFVTHDLAVARFVADRIAVMYLGRIVEIGPAEEVTRDPAHPYTRALLAAVPDLDREPPRAPRASCRARCARPSGCPYHPRCMPRRARPVTLRISLCARSPARARARPPASTSTERSA